MAVLVVALPDVGQHGGKIRGLALLGQLLGAGLILSSAMSLYYAPVMLVLGLVMGALTSLTLRAILPALGRLGYNTREKR